MHTVVLLELLDNLLALVMFMVAVYLGYRLGHHDGCTETHTDIARDRVRRIANTVVASREGEQRR